MKKSKIYELKNILTNGINEISDNEEGKKVLNALKKILIAKKKILKWRRKRKKISWKMWDLISKKKEYWYLNMINILKKLLFQNVIS